MEPALGRRQPTRSSSKSYTDTHTDSLSYDIITHTLDPIQDRIHIQPVRKLSVWRAVLKERYCRTPVNHIRCIWRDQNKQRQPCTTNVNDSLDDCYNDAPEDILLSIIQIHTDTTKLLTITLYYTTGTIMLQGRACRRWVNHEFECHKVVVNAIDKLRPCSSNTMNDSNCLVSVSVSVGNGGATATIAAGTPTTCDNTDNTASVGSYDTVAAVAVSTASDDCDNTAAVSSDVAPSADATAAGTTIVSDDSDNASSFSSDAAPSAHATTAVSDDSDNTASVSSDVAPSAHATAAVSDHSDDNIASVSSKVAPSADATAAGTTIVSDDSDNTVSFGGDDARTAGSLGLSDPAAAITTDTPILTDNSDNAIPAGGDTAIAAESRGFSDPASVITTSTPIPTGDSDNAISVDGNTATAPVAVITTSTPIPTDDSDNAIPAGGNAATAPVALITTSTPIPTEDSDNAIPAGGNAATAPVAVITTSTPIPTDDKDSAISVSGDAAIATDSDNTPVSRDSAAVSITTDTPSVADAANTSVDGVSAAAAAITSDHSTDECCSDTFICTLCSAGVRVLFDQFKVEQSNSLKSVVTGLNNDLRDVRQENLDMKATIERNTRKIKALEDRLSKCSVSPIVNSQTGMQCHTTSGRSPNAQKLDGQTQTGLLPMPQTPPTDKSTTSLRSTTTDTTTDSSTLNSEQSKQLSTNKTAPDSSADSAMPDIRVNRSRQVPPSLRLPKEGSLDALLIGDSNLRHVDRRRLDQNGKIHVRTVGGATAGDFSASLTNQSPREDTSHVIVHIGTNDCSDTNYDKQLVTVSFRALAKQLVRVFPKAAIAFTSILPLNSGYTQAIEDTNQMLSSMCSSYGFVYLLEPTFSVKQPRHKLKQLFSDVVHLNQRGLAILLRRIISFLPRSQRQLPHTKLTRQQRPGGDNVKSACDAAVRKLESASRRTQDPHKDSHKVNHKDSHQSHQPHYRVDTNRTKSSTGTAAIHRRHPGGPSLPDGGAVVTRGSHDGSRLEPPYSGPPPAQWPPLAGGPPPHEPPLSGCPLDRWPRHPASGMSMRTGENQQNRWSQLRHHGLYDGPHCTTPPRGPPPFQWHHSGGPPMPPFPYPFPWHFNPYNPWPPHHSYVQQPRSQSQ